MGKKGGSSSSTNTTAEYTTDPNTIAQQPIVNQERAMSPEETKSYLSDISIPLEIYFCDMRFF